MWIQHFKPREVDHWAIWQESETMYWGFSRSLYSFDPYAKGWVHWWRARAVVEVKVGVDSSGIQPESGQKIDEGHVWLDDQDALASTWEQIMLAPVVFLMKQVV